MTIWVNTIGGHDSNAFIDQILLMILLFDVVRNKLDKHDIILRLSYYMEKEFWLLDGHVIWWFLP